MRAQCYSLLCAVLIFSLCEREPMLSGPCIASLTATIVYKHWPGQGQRLADIYQLGHLVHLVLSCLFCSGSSPGGISMGYNNTLCLYIWVRPHVSSPELFVPHLPILLLQDIDHKQNKLTSLRHLYMNRYIASDNFSLHKEWIGCYSSECSIYFQSLAVM